MVQSAFKHLDLRAVIKVTAPLETFSIPEIDPSMPAMDVAVHPSP